MGARDALVLLVIVLAAVSFIEALILYDAGSGVLAAQPVPTQTSSVTVTSTGISTVVSDATSTVTTGTTQSLTDTLTQTSTTTATSTSTATQTVSVTTTATKTTTSTVHLVGPFVTIPPGSGANRSSNGFLPAVIKVIIGVNATVTWINEDNVLHTVTSLSSTEPFNSGNLGSGQSYTFTFTLPGTYSYTSTYQSWESGTVIVEP